MERVLNTMTLQIVYMGFASWLEVSIAIYGWNLI
jgi:hypothetical protein